MDGSHPPHPLPLYLAQRKKAIENSATSGQISLRADIVKIFDGGNRGQSIV